LEDKNKQKSGKHTANPTEILGNGSYFAKKDAPTHN